MGTKAELVELLRDYTTNDEDGFVARIPDFIRASEERIWYFIQVPKFRKQGSTTCVIGDETLTLASDFLAMASMWTTAGGYQPIDNKDETYLREVYPDTTDTARPKVYAQLDDDTVILAPVPDATYAVSYTYFYKPSSLADEDDDGTTWLSLKAFEALKFGALMEASIYMKKQSGVDPMGDEYEKQFMTCITALANLGEVRLRKDVNRGGEKRRTEVVQQ